MLRIGIRQAADILACSNRSSSSTSARFRVAAEFVRVTLMRSLLLARVIDARANESAARLVYDPLAN